MACRVQLILIASGLCLAMPSTTAEARSLVPEGRLVLAHYMTNMVPCTVGETSWASPELYYPSGSAKAMGGLYLTLPMWAVLKPQMTLSEAVDFEIRTARQLGVDGFQFFYPAFASPRPLQKYNRIIRQFIRIAEARYPEFRVTLCLCAAGRQTSMSEDELIALWGKSIRELLEDTRRSPIWLRSGEGRLLFYEWASDGLADGVRHRAKTAHDVRLTAAAFRRLARRIGDDIDWIFHVRHKEIDDRYTDAVLQEFPAVWGWVDSDEQTEFWDYLADRCRQAGVAWTQTVYPDYFTSKVYARDERRPRILTPTQAMEQDPDGVERHYRQTNLAEGQIRMLKAAIRRDAQLINYATWNDWPEGHHLAPEVNHNFGPSLILRHFKAQWQHRPSPISEVGILFFKKHPSTAVATHQIAVHVKSQLNSPSDEDIVQLVTILKRPAKCTMNGERFGSIRSGFQVTDLPLPPDGQIEVHLRRAGQPRPFVTLRPPLTITNRPGRVDRLTYSFSSEFESEFDRVFGREASPPSIAAP